MARSGIRYEEVRDAAESLLGRGLNPTIQRVRELLGTGSNTTISEHLKSWQRQLAETPRTILPPAVPDAVMAALEPFWKIAVQQAEAAFEEQRAMAAQAVATAEHARAAAIAEHARARREADDLHRQFEAAQLTARELTDRLLLEQERRATAETAIQNAEQRVQASTEAVAQIRAETEARVEQLEAALRQSRLDMAQQMADAQQRLDYERQRGEANETRLMRLLDQQRAERATERQAFATERQDWKIQESNWRTQKEVQQREQAEARAALAVTEARARAQENELRQLQAALQGAENRYLEALRAAEAARGELKATLSVLSAQRRSQANRPFPDVTPDESS